MMLILLSIVMGIVGFIIGGLLGADIFIFMFGIIGFLSPALFVLDGIYKAC